MLKFVTIRRLDTESHPLSCPNYVQSKRVKLFLVRIIYSQLYAEIHKVYLPPISNHLYVCLFQHHQQWQILVPANIAPIQLPGRFSISLQLLIKLQIPLKKVEKYVTEAATRCSIKRAALKNFTMFTGKYLC